MKHSALILLLVIYVGAASSFGAINATASLSRNHVAAGDVVQLDVKVTGAQQADVPSELAAEGLQIKLTGQSSEVQMVNFNVSSSIIYSYIVVPLKTGNLTIPPVTVRAGGQIMKTSALSLAVIGSGQPPSQGPPQRSSTNIDRDRLGYAEIVIPKKKFYVGEVVPVEIRFCVDANYEASPIGPPNFGGEGILTDRLKDPERSQEERYNSIYNVATFRTLFTAVKSGSLELPAATLDIVVAIPEAIPAGMDADLFLRLLGGRSPSVHERKMRLKTTATHCDVMPLPAEGRPADFSGAIGEFKLEGSVSPQKAVQGDPVVLSLKLAGKGNFQALKEPLLTETQGWRAYPPVDHFEAMDLFGWKGVKTFETTMIAQQAVTATPGSSFSYFDPVVAKYVTLTTKPLPIEMIGATSAPVSTTLMTAAPGASATPAPPATAMTGGRLEKMTERPWRGPLHRQEWLLSWAACFLALLGVIGVFSMRLYLQRVRSPREEAQQRLAALIRDLEQEEFSDIEFYDRAAKAAELILKDNLIEEEGLSEILKRRDEIHYGSRGAFLTTLEKKRVIEVLTMKRQAT